MLTRWFILLVVANVLGFGVGMILAMTPQLLRSALDRRRGPRPEADVPLARLVSVRADGARRAWVQRAEAAARAGWRGGDPLVVMTAAGELEEVP